MLQEQLVCIFIYLKSSFVPSLDPSRCLSSSSSAPRPYLDGEERAATFSANTNPSRLNVWLTPVTPLLSNSTATQTEISFWQSDRTAITANARNWVFWGGEWEKKLKCPKNSLLPRKRQQQKTKDRECICAFCLWLSRHTGFEGSSPLEGSAHWPVAGIKKSNHFTAMSSELSTDVLEKKRHKRKKRGEEHDACVFPSAIVILLFWPVKEHQYLQKSMKKWAYSRNLVQFTKQIFICTAGRHTALRTGTDEATVCWSQLGEFTSALYVTEWEIIICNEN